VKPGGRKIDFWGALFCYLALLGTFLLAGAIGGMTSPSKPESRTPESQAASQTPLEIAQADLIAQQDMANWAFWAMIGGILTMAGSFAALYFIRATLQATRDTLQEQRDRNAVEMRAYIVVIPQGIEQDIRELRYRGYIEIHNIGKTPAHNVSAKVRMKQSHFNEGNFPTKPFKKLADRTLLPDARMRQATKDTAPITDFAAKPGYIFVYGRIDYTDHLNQRRSTLFCHRYNKATLELDLEKIIPASAPKVLVRTALARHHIHGNSAD
jgi:hypothetical protein